MYEVVIIKATGEIERTRQKEKPSTEQCQRAVGGFTETVPEFTKFETLKHGTAYCNEEGLLHHLPINDIAINYWRKSCPKGDPNKMALVGDIIFYAKVRD